MRCKNCLCPGFSFLELFSKYVNRFPFDWFQFAFLFLYLDRSALNVCQQELGLTKLVF